MKKQNCFPLLLVLFLALSSGTVLGDEANVCANDPIHIVNCSKLLLLHITCSGISFIEISCKI
ncbi:hypothetical protein ACOSQ4_028797 [Xanthoceras sorbifolium]